MRLFLVGTVHVENGLANVVALQAILERQKPDVIFAEIPTTHSDAYCEGTHDTLESIAVARHRRGHHIAVIPVDLVRPEEAFFRNAEEMFRKIERTSRDYRRLIDRHSHDTRTGGFPYLNSDRCTQAWNDIHSEVLAALEWIHDPQLHEVYSHWRDQNKRRDVAMVKNIAQYAERQSFHYGSFLVGAAHRQSIAEKAQVALGSEILRHNEDL